jgi:hypothetical protein
MYVQIPADLLSFNGHKEADVTTRLAAVKAHVAAMRAMIARSEDDTIKQRVKEEAAAEGQAGDITLVRQVPQNSWTVIPASAPSSYHGGAGSVLLTSGLPVHDGDAGFILLTSGSSVYEGASGSLVLTSGLPAHEEDVGAIVYKADSLGDMRVRSFVFEFAARENDDDECAGAALEDLLEPVSHADSSVPASDETQQRVEQPEEAPAAGEVVPEAATEPTKPTPRNRPAFDLTQVPAQLDAAFLAHDTRAALRPTTLTPGTDGWLHRSYSSLLSNAPNIQSWTHASGEILAAKAAAFDLLDALSRSGALPLRHAALHVVVAASHYFDSTLIDTVVQHNVNPIEAVERSLLLIARSIHGRPVSALVAEDQVARIARHSADLLQDGFTAAVPK